ncbi:DUF222 domain-containing protein [Arthrobacter sp. H41]|uniref:DUF222 domain-containing protein n=1 Tax=Arthrobacter sp. H41 TaxID=1312978 RepID=UPI000675F52F|nr:DUF222 domain-containing protein [Arthrobacter sp. H41]
MTSRAGEPIPDSSGASTPEVKPGLSGAIALLSVESLDAPSLTAALARLGTLVAWAQAGQAEVMHLLEERFQEEMRHNGLAAKAEQRGRPESGSSTSSEDPVAGAAAGPFTEPSGGAAGEVIPDESGPGVRMCDTAYLRRLRRADEELAESLTATEIACALSLSERTALTLLRESHALCGDFPGTFLALRNGVITYHHASAILEQADGIVPSARKDFEDCLLAAAPGRTRAQLARLGRRERERHHPESIVVRQGKAAADRRVELAPEKDGMCWLSAFLPAETALGVFGMVTGLAKSVQGPDEPRTLTQLRADVLVDLLTGFEPKAQAGCESRSEGVSDVPPLPSGQKIATTDVLVTMDVQTLLGLAENPAQLEGYGPISPVSARELTAVSKHFIPLLVDKNQNVLAMGRNARLPSTLLRRWVRFRDETCRFPGCSRAAPRCEVDHSVPWSQGGATDHRNLSSLCAKHHRFKSITSWNLTDNASGVLSWTSPAHRTYVTYPAHSLKHGATAPLTTTPLNSPVPPNSPVKGASKDAAEALAADPAPF